MEQTRKTPRYPFLAPAEVIAQTSDAKIESQVKELSLYGCYLDTPSPLPVRTRVTVKIYGSHEFFEATATVIYANAMLGMGLVFREVRPTSMEVLRGWLIAAMHQVEQERREVTNQAGENPASDVEGQTDEASPGGKPDSADDSDP